MAQHDYNVANATGANFRADVNNVLQAIVTVNSGAAEPSPTFAGMLWLDMSGGGDGILKRRNAGNSGWLTDIGKDQIARDAAAAAQATADAAMPKSGGTFSGPINLPAALATNNQAISRAGADVLYQLKLPTAIGGALLIGTAGGWTSTLAAAANDNVLTISGGLPNWQATAQTANPNAIVRAKSDGTIDPSFIPGVASGLKFCGTFKPVVNNEYPTTGGHGAAGAPAIGDFWVVDGLTTGGYTYLVGSLAGVTVYNGDSIAYNGAGVWYRMGTTVNLTGYLKTDGSVAMAGDLNLGTFRVTNASGIIARAGALVPLQGFRVDTTNAVVSPQRSSGPDLPVMEAGQLGTDLGRSQLFVGNGTSNARLIAIPFHSQTATYAGGDYVWSGGSLWRAIGAVSAGAFAPSQWAAVLDSQGGAVNGSLIVSTAAGASFRALSPGQTNYMDMGAGRTGVSDPDGWLAARAGSLYLYATNQIAKLDSVTGMLSATSLQSNGGNVVGSAGSIVIAPAVTGTIYFRPNGPGASSAEWKISASDGHLVGAYLVKAAGFEGVTSNTVIANMTGTTSGAIYVRPRGPAVAAGQIVIDYGGSIQVSADVYAGSGNYFSTSTSMVFQNITTPGLIYVRANTNTTGQAYFNPQGDLALTGNIIAANHPASDARMKSNITNAPPRHLDGLPWYAFTLNDAAQLGVIAQDVQKVAPEWVFTFGHLENGQLVDRLGVNYGGLAMEIALDVLARVAALEAVAGVGPGSLPPPPEPAPSVSRIFRKSRKA
jgi:hypothetical protein